MEKWLKVFDVIDGNQVLVTKKQDENGTDDYDYKLNIRTEFEDFTPEMKLSFPSEESRDKGFEKYDQEQAQKFYDEMTQFQNNNS